MKSEKCIECKFIKQNRTAKRISLSLFFFFIISIHAFAQTATQTAIDNTAVGSNVGISGYTWRVAIKINNHTDGRKYAMLYGMSSFHNARFGADNVYNTSEVRAAFTTRFATNSEYANLRPIAVLATMNNGPGFSSTAKSDLPANPQLASISGATQDVIFLPTVKDVRDLTSIFASSFSGSQRLITRNPFSPGTAYMCAFISSGGSLVEDGGIAATTSPSGQNLQFRPCIWVRITPLDPVLGSITAPAPLCPGDDLVLSAPIITENDATITSQGWQIETSVGSGSFTDISLPYQVAGSDDGKKIRFYITFSTPFSSGTVYSNEVAITTFQPGTPVIWTPENNSGMDKRNWNNPDNWTPVLVPSSCHNVFIPGNLPDYPVLTGQVSCNNIYFMQGAELGRPDLLTYEKAYIQLNFDLKQSSQQKENNKSLVLNSTSTTDRLKYSAAVSSTPLNRERWYLLSSPLRGVVTGDLGFGGFPLSFLMKFGPVEKDNVNYQVGKWTTTYTSMTDSVSTAVTDGFAFYMYGFNMTGDNTGCPETGLYATLNDMPILPSNRSALSYGLRETNGILELPFFADSTGLYAHRTQVYEGDLTRRSTFFAIDDGTSSNGMAIFNHLTGTSKTVTREANGGNYRFIPETYNGSAWVFPPTVNHPGTGIGSDDEFLVGNPYMSSIDMAKFITENSTTILPQFRVWNGSSYIDYTVSGGVVTSPIPGDLNPGYIAPLQAFILRSDGNPGGGTVAAFNVNTISAVRPSGASNLRSTTAEENIIRIKAENNLAASYMLIGYKENASEGFLKRGDVQKLFSFLDYVPEVYTLANNTPASIRFVGNKKEEIVPLGIKTGRTGEIRLTFTGMDNYSKATKIELIDAKENRTVDLTGKSSYTYTFNHTETGISNGRLSLRIGASMTAIQDIAISDELKVYGDSEGIYVLSSSSDPVQQLIIYDFQGKKIYESASGANYYPMQGNTGHSPLIVKVITKNGMKTVKLVISD